MKQLMFVAALLLVNSAFGQTIEYSPFSVEVKRSDYVLVVYEENQPILEQKVVLGKPHRKTPLFSTYIDRVEFNPYWDVPQRIQYDIYEKLASAKNPIALIREKGYRFFNAEGEVDPTSVNWKNSSHDFHVRQEPGDKNMLGRIMFVLVDSNEVQMHDTPMKELFDQPVRGFSSGCIRVHDARTLASLFLGMGVDEIQQMIDTGKNRYIDLPKKVPVKVIE